MESTSVHLPAGFLAGSINSGIKRNSSPDLGVIYSKVRCKVAGVFTTNLIKSPCVLYSQKVVRNGYAQAIIANSGCANACTGRRGMQDVKEMAELTAKKFSIRNENVIVASTGVIGINLPMEKIRYGINEIILSEEGGDDFANAILTTDTRKKTISLRVQDDAGDYIITGVAKGAGMIFPNMATMLCFITTDAKISGNYLKYCLGKAVDKSFNMVSVDADKSTNDMVIILSSCLAGNQVIRNKNGNNFLPALEEVCTFLAMEIARDGEGATKLIEVNIEGARNQAEAKLLARAIASSALVKTAMHGNDPNWGRIIAAAGASGAYIIESKLDLYLNGICILKNGKTNEFDFGALSNSIQRDSTVYINVCTNIGKARARAWGCDLSEEYVTINSAYTT